jgi:hypothetical protein
LARPIGQEAGNWYGDVAVQVRAPTEAFRHHVEQSEGPKCPTPKGLLLQIVEAAPRLAPALEVVKREHQALLDQISRVEAAAGLPQDADEQAVRKESLRLFTTWPPTGQRGADLIYEAYYVDVEGGD